MYRRFVSIFRTLFSLNYTKQTDVKIKSTCFLRNWGNLMVKGSEANGTAASIPAGPKSAQ
ncbi:hypothetical protein MUY_001271 [Bacillus licheniformis WX-02]|nr:hypothetical protein MUY_001271 [Bacillus licheniformis WX-02]